jgi:hypothetical protein
VNDISYDRPSGNLVGRIGVTSAVQIPPITPNSTIRVCIRPASE